MNEPISYDARLRIPFTAQCIGSTSSGKSTLVRHLLDASAVMFNPVPHRKLYVWGVWQNMFDTMKDVEFLTPSQLTPDFLKPESLGGPTILVLDDVSDEIDGKLLEKLFTAYSHHYNLGVFYLNQNPFYQGLKGHGRTINLNTQLIFLHNSPRAMSYVTTLARQLFGGSKMYKLMLQAYEDATRERYSYLLVDTRPDTPPELMFRTKILPGEENIVYLQK